MSSKNTIIMLYDHYTGHQESIKTYTATQTTLLTVYY